MGNAQVTAPVRPARDWGRLLREARAGGCSDGLAATFIADNTADRRADGGNNSFPEGYHGMIETWIEQENARVPAGKPVSLTSVRDARSAAGEAGEFWYRAALEEAAKSLEMSADTIRLHAGELTAQEMRAVKAVLRWKAWDIREKGKVART